MVAAATILRTHRVDSASDDPPQGVPGEVIKPVPELIEAVLGQELSHPVVEVGVKLVDDALILDDRKQAHTEGQGANAHQCLQ